jgi:hypothetical protein
MLFQKVGPRSGIRPRPTLVIPSDVVPGLSMTSVLTTSVNRRVSFPLLKTMTLTVCNNFPNLELRTTFGNPCNVILCDVKYGGDCISGLTFVWGNLIWSCVSVVYRDVTRQAKGLHRLKHVGALGSGLSYLSRYNSGWFCHKAYVLHNWCAYGPTVTCGGPVPRVGMKGKRLLRNYRWIFQACELGLPCKVTKFDSESSVSRGYWDCLFLLPHRVRTVIIVK